MRIVKAGLALLLMCVATTTFAAGAAASVAAKAEAKAIPSPLETPRAIVDALRANDSEALAEATTDKPTSELAKDWERERAEHARRESGTSHGDAELVRVWSLLATDAGAQQLVDEWQPALAEKATSQVVAMNVGLAAALSGIASSAELRAEEVARLSQLVVAVQSWANRIDWNDRARLERAVGAMSGFVQRSKLATPIELPLVPYEQALALGDDAIATAKAVLRAYDLDVDATLDSLQMEELERDGEHAVVRVRATVLEVPIELVRELYYEHTWGGRWVDSHERARRLEAQARFEEQESIENVRKAPEADADEEAPGSCGEQEDTPESAKQWAAPASGAGTND